MNERPAVRGVLRREKLRSRLVQRQPRYCLNQAVARLNEIIRALGPPDRQIITLYLEGLDAKSISEVTGLSAGAVATRVSRLKSQLARLFQETANV